MDRIPVSSGDVIGVTNDADVGPVAVSYSAGPARILRRAITAAGDDRGRYGQRNDPTNRPTSVRTTGPKVGKVYHFSVVPFALEFSLNADVGNDTIKSQHMEDKSPLKGGVIGVT